MDRRHLVLQDRDYRLLAALADYRYLTTSQIRSRFFSRGPFVYRRLKKLADHDLIVRLQREVVGEASELVHALAPEGARLLARRSGSPTAGFSTHRKASRVFLEHELALNRFRLAFEAGAEREDAVSIERWTTRVTPPVPGSKRLIPDAWVVLATPRGRTHFFVEVDMGTEPVPRIVREKLVPYAAYQRSGLFEKETGVGLFRTLMVIHSARVADRLVDHAAKIPPQGIFWFSEHASTTAESVLTDAIWRRADRPGQLYALYNSHH